MAALHSDNRNIEIYFKYNQLLKLSLVVIYLLQFLY